MTNSRLTDPEVLELRFPVLLEDFHIREGSGGKGKWTAGDGTSRTIRFLEKMECAILSSHRTRPPRGLDGGGDGAGRRDRGPPARRPHRDAARLRPDGARGGRGGDRHDADRGGIWADLSRVVSRCHLTVTRFIYPLRNPRAEMIPQMTDLSTELSPRKAKPIRTAVYQNKAVSREGFSERLFALAFSGLVYPQIWEDPEVDMEAMAARPKATASSPSPRAAATSSPISRARRLRSTPSTSTRRTSRSTA